MYSSGELRGTRTVTLVLSFISTSLHLLCCISPEWLLVQELAENPFYIKYNMTVEAEFLKRYSYAGLFTICTHRPTNITYESIRKQMNCSYIDIFGGDEYSPDPNDSTPVLPYCMKRGVIIMAISLVALLGGVVFSIAFACYMPRVTGQSGLKYRFPKPVLAFITGTFFIIAGLAVTTALVALVSTFKSEVGIKLRKTSTFEDPRLAYQHGWGMYLAVFALLSCETTGTFAILAYIHAHQLEFWEDVWPSGRSPSVNRRRELRVFATSGSKMTSQDEEDTLNHEPAVYNDDVADDEEEEEDEEDEDEEDEDEDEDSCEESIDERERNKIAATSSSNYHNNECTCRFYEPRSDPMCHSSPFVQVSLPSPPSPPPLPSIVTSLPQVTVGVDSASSSSDATRSLSPPIPPQISGGLRRPSPNDLVSWTLLKEPPRGRRYSRTIGLDNRDPSPLPLLLLDRSPRESLTLPPPNLAALLENRRRSSFTPPPVNQKSPLPRLAAGVPFELRKKYSNSNERSNVVTGVTLPSTSSSSIIKSSAHMNKLTHQSSLESKTSVQPRGKKIGAKKKDKCSSHLRSSRKCPRHKSTPV